MKASLLLIAALLAQPSFAKGFQLGTCEFPESAVGPSGRSFDYLEFEGSHERRGDRVNVVFWSNTTNAPDLSPSYDVKYIRFANGQVRGIELYDGKTQVLKATLKKVYATLPGFKIPSGGWNADCRFH